MKPPARARILEYLGNQQTASAKELSRALKLTGADIRHHLAVLASNDQVEVIGKRQEGRGRPVNLYGLSGRVLGNGLEALSEAVLSSWLVGLTEDQRAQALRSIAKRLIGGEESGEASPSPRRLTEVVDLLNQLHYQARWEAAAAGPRIVLGHCPYAAIIEAHPELCHMDAFLLQGKLGQAVQQTAKLQYNKKGVPVCEFLAAEANR